ncbi:unnamed protein product [Paramecium pentaurelia]|uniref:RING-type domain-containing protein n=1 Tax=Paramecium pentaurelia TaxID=43138 RepID=A0A8S1TFZ2_9CILI|nr:unnamed protein product [Paramecium pentaurelia]
MFLILILSLGTSKQIFSKEFKQMNGQVNIETDIFDRIRLTQYQRLIITLSNYNSNIQPLLLICKSSPSFLKIPDYLEINKDQCVADLNSYDYQKSFQTAIISINQFAGSFQNIIYQIDLKNISIIVIQDQISDFFIKYEILDKKICYIKCQNKGYCNDGICKCKEQYIGDDCSLKIFNLKYQDKLVPNQIYYLTIEKQELIRFEFKENCSFFFECIINYPFYKRGQLKVQSYIQISLRNSQECIDNFRYSNYQFSQFKQPLYLFSTTNFVQIIKSESQEILNSNTIVYIVSFVGLALLLVFIIACIIWKKRISQISDISRNSLQMSQKTELINQVNKLMPIQTYEQLIKNFPGLIDDQYCQICLQNYNKDHKIRISYCTHFFHAECLDIWIEKNENCPTCRSSLNYETLNKLTDQDRIDEGLFQNISSSKHPNTYLSKQKIRLYGEIKSSNSPIIKV